MINAITDLTHRNRMYAEVVYPLYKLANELKLLHRRLLAHINFYNDITFDSYLKDSTFIALFQEGLNFMQTGIDSLVFNDLNQIRCTYRLLISSLSGEVLLCMPEDKDLQVISEAFIELADILGLISVESQNDKPNYLNMSAILLGKLEFLNKIVEGLDKTIDEILDAYASFGLTNQKDYAKALKNRTKLKCIYGSKVDSFSNIKTNRITRNRT